MDLDLVVSDVKSKKSLKSLDSSFVKGLVLDYFSKYTHIQRRLDSHPRFQKSKDYKFMVKYVRKMLHDVYGVFNLHKKNLSELESHLKRVKKLDDKSLEIHAKILRCHKSTQERFPSYSPLYVSIFRVTGKPSIILDLACGLNPFSFPWMGIDHVFYYAYELSEEDSSFIQSYFDIMKSYSSLEGKSVSADLLKLPSLPKSDVCFLFKVLDSLELIKKGISAELLAKINSKYVIVSFPTRSIGGKKRLKPRAWFLSLLKKLDSDCKTIELENEIFYIIKNK